MNFLIDNFFVTRYSVFSSTFKDNDKMTIHYYISCDSVSYYFSSAHVKQNIRPFDVLAVTHASFQILKRAVGMNAEMSNVFVSHFKLTTENGTKNVS